MTHLRKFLDDLVDILLKGFRVLGQEFQQFQHIILREVVGIRSIDQLQNSQKQLLRTFHHTQLQILVQEKFLDDL